MLSSNPASNGVSSMPSRLDAVAAHKAAGTLPRAIEVNAIEDWTVEGSTDSRIRPVQSGALMRCGATARAARASAGNSTKVDASTNTCSRQLLAPASAALGARRAPWRKNSNAMAMVVRWPATTAPVPCAGNSDARPTMPTMAAM